MKNSLALVSLFMLMVTPAIAGSTNNKESRFEPEVLTGFAKGVEKIAAQQGARAFIIGRQGRPTKDLPKGIQFTHTAVAIYSNITLDSGEAVNGYAIYNLYQEADNADVSRLVQDYPVDFYSGAQELTAGVIIPDIEVQMALVELISSGDYKKLHNPKYSVLANPHNSLRQNCTEFTLDMINAAIYETTDITRLKTNAKNWFEPQKVAVSRFKLSLGGLFSAGITTKDHKGDIKTATFSSIARYLQENDLLQAALKVDQNLATDDLI